MGKTIDFITGREIRDTDDERYRQKLARLLVEGKGYAKEDIECKRRLEMTIGDEKVLSMVDFVVRVEGKAFMAIRYGRHRTFTQGAENCQANNTGISQELPHVTGRNAGMAGMALVLSQSLHYNVQSRQPQWKIP